MSPGNGDQWQGFPGGIIPANDVALDEAGIIYVCGWWGSDGRWPGHGGILRSTDLGVTWTGHPVPDQPNDFAASRLHVTQQGMFVVLVSWVDYGGFRHYRTYSSTNGGSSWPVSVSTSHVYDYTSTNNGYLFAAMATGFYRSSDSGQTWNPSVTGLPSSDIQSLATNDSDVVFAGSATRGVFRSTNHGENWEPFNVGLTDSSITSLYCTADGYLFAGTFNQGIFKTSQRTTSVGEPKELSPTTFALYQNYPNPFNPTTIIRFSVGTYGHTSLRVFDLLGKEVATLVNEEMEPGSYERTLDANGLASGVYFYRLQARQTNGGQAGSFVQTRKLVLLR